MATFVEERVAHGGAAGEGEKAKYIWNVSDAETVPDEQPAIETTPSPLTGASAFKTHLTLVLGLACCVAAFWFELGRAEAGNGLSWAYVFEWPLLAIFAVYMWWKILHPGFRFRRARKSPTVAPEYQGMLEAWQGEVQKLEMSRRAEEAGSAQSGEPAKIGDE
ncbi:MAG TPA: hypothetical protein VIJ99_02840 [Acidimicrobiales bacterium]